MQGLNYHSNQDSDLAAIHSMGGGINSIAFSLPQLQMQRQRLQQQMILQNAQRILREVQAKEVQQRVGLIQAQTEHNQAQTAETKQRTSGLMQHDQQLGILADAIRNIQSQGIDPMQNPGTMQAALTPVMSSTAYLQGAKNPANLAEALAGMQRLYTMNPQDRLGLASVAMNRPIPMGQTVETGIHAPISVPRGGMVYDEANQPIMTGQPVLGTPGSRSSQLANTILSAMINRPTRVGTFNAANPAMANATSNYVMQALSEQKLGGASNKRPTKAIALDYVNRLGKEGAIQKLKEEGYDLSGYAD